MIKTALVIAALLGAAILLMSVRIIFRKGGRFHSQHIGQSKAMRERGITCVQSMDAMERSKQKKRV